MHSCSPEQRRLLDDGYVLIDGLLWPEEVADVRRQLASLLPVRTGDRRLLDREWCRVLAQVLRLRLLRRRLLPADSRPVLCTFFNCDTQTEWGLQLQREVHIPVARRVAVTGWRNWTVRQGIPHVQAPEVVLQRLLAVRLHVDHCAGEDVALRLVPSSHRLPREHAEAIACAGPRGSGLVMSPLVLHGAGRSPRGAVRRVLRFLFGPATLPSGARWYYDL